MYRPLNYFSFDVVSAHIYACPFVRAYICAALVYIKLLFIISATKAVARWLLFDERHHQSLYSTIFSKGMLCRVKRAEMPNSTVKILTELGV